MYTIKAMATYDEYRADTFRVFGLALMTPFGKWVLDLPNLKLDVLNIQSIICFVLNLILFYFGIILVLKGFEIMETQKRKEWKIRE